MFFQRYGRNPFPRMIYFSRKPRDVIDAMHLPHRIHLRWGVSSPCVGASHTDMMHSSRAPCRRSGGPRRGLGRGARDRLDDVRDARDAPGPDAVVVDLVQRGHDLAVQFLLQPGLVEGGGDRDP